MSISLPLVKKAKGMTFKATKSKVSSDEDSDNEEELAMIANKINKLMKTDNSLKECGKLLVKPSQKKIQEVRDVASALALGT
jgi:hypothetical protein